MKKLMIMLLAMTCLLCGCGGKQETKEETAETAENAVVDIVVKDYGTITLELDGTAAPITVANFVKLAEEGFLTA